MTDGLSLVDENDDATPILRMGGLRCAVRCLIKSLAQPGRNVTGFSGGGPELATKELSLLKEPVPDVRVVGVLVGNRDRYKVEYLEQARRSLGLALVQFEMTRPDEVDEAFQAFAKAGASGVMDFAGTPSTYEVRDRLAALAIRYRLPMVSCLCMPSCGSTATVRSQV